MLKKVRRLAYRLDVSPNWRIYLIFLVAWLKPASLLSQDQFQRPHPNHPSSVFIEGDIDFSQSLEVERLLNCCIIKRSKKKMIQYLVRWVGYGPEFDQ